MTHKRQTWEEFRETGLLLIVNQILHIFGWAISFNFDEEGELVEVVPVRLSYRGFSEDAQQDAYERVSKYMDKHSKELLKEAEDCSGTKP